MSTRSQTPEWERRFFNLGRGATIALILVIVAALAGVGLLAATVAKTDKPTSNLPQTSDGHVDLGAALLGEEGAGPARGGLPGRGTILADVRGNVLRALAGSRLGQTSTPTEPTPFPTDTTGGITPTPTPSTGGETGAPTSISLGGGVTAPVPADWTLLDSGDNWAALFDANINYVYAEVDTGLDPASDAASILQIAYTNLVGNNTGYSQLQASDPEALQVFGGMASRARLFYDGIWNDSQFGAYPVTGFMALSIRSDGSALVYQFEVSPPDTYDQWWTNDCQPFYQPLWQSFAGEPFPYDPC